MKTFKNLFTTLLLLCATVATAHDFEVGGIYYIVTDAANKTVEVTYRGTDYMEYSNEYTGSVVIPESVTYNGTTYGVTSIGESAFWCCTGLTSIEIPNSVTSIRNRAFYYCTGLTSVEIPNSVTSIGDYAFSYCTGLTSIEIPNSVTSIGESAFCDCTGLTSVEIPNSVTSIERYAFWGCSRLTSIEIPNSVTSIGESAFSGCTGLTSVVIPNSVTSIDEWAFNGCRGLTNVVIPNSVTSIDDWAFSYCTGLTSVEIPNSVTSIGYSTFSGCSGLTSIIVATGNANYDSRDNCNAIIETATNTLVAGCKNTLIPSSVTCIGDYAFSYCTGLTSVVIPNSVTSIGNSAFEDCTGLTSIVIPNSVTSIGSSAFENCRGLTSVVIPNSVTSIGGAAFSGCSGLTSIEIPNSVTSIGSSAFENCRGLTSVVIPNSVTSIGNSAFWGCSGLTSIIVATGNANYDSRDNCNAIIETATNTLVAGCKNTLIPSSVTSIGNSAFWGCSGLTSIEIPNSVTSIGDKAFDGCKGLKTVVNLSNLTFSKGSSGYGYVAYYADKVYNAPNGSIEGDYIFGKPNNVNTLLYYLGNATELTLPADYKGENYAIGASVFKDNTTITSVVIPNSVTSIGDFAFYNCTGLTAVHISDLAAWCGIDFASTSANPLCYAKNLYLNGEQLTNLTIPAEIVEIKNYTFYNCNNLTSVEIPNSVTSIGNSAFGGCTGLTSIEIPNSITSITPLVFDGCTGLTSVEIPSSVISIGDYAFRDCIGLTSIEIPNSVTSIGGAAFRGCTGLTAVHISDLAAWCGIDFENEYANPLYYAKNLYLNGEKLTELVIPYGIVEIKDYTFYNCTGLASVVIPNSVTSIGRSTFRGCSGLTSIEIPGSVTSIGRYTFYNCSGLTGIVIPNSVTSIGDYAFEGCSGLKTIYNLSNLTLSKGSSNNGYVAYYADNVYNLPEGFIENDFVLGRVNGVNTLLTYLGNATELTLPADYKGESYIIDADVFKGNTTIASIEIPNSVTSIGNNAFYGCSGLTGIEIPNSVTSIGYYAFYGCTALTAVHISDLAAWCGIDFGSGSANPLYYAKNLYLNGEQLTNLTIPAEIVEVKDYAFYNCNGVTNIDIVDGVKSIGSNAFYGCSNLETLYISNTIESIGNYAFAECNNILDIKTGSKKAITASENIFSSDAYNNACLYVPTDRKFAYEKTAPWSNFYIVEMDFTGIEELKSENGKVKTIYDLNGRAVENPAKGIYIINGKKVFVK